MLYTQICLEVWAYCQSDSKYQDKKIKDSIKGQGVRSKILEV